MIGDKQYEDEHGLHFESICETFLQEDAEKIAAALNKAEEP